MSKIVDSNGKLFGKINLLDFIILTIFIVALLGGCYKLFFVDNTVYTPDYKQGHITLRLTGITESEVDVVKKGDLISVPKVQKLGIVKEIEVAHRIDNVNSIDGNVYTLENPLNFELTVILDTDELFTRDGFIYVGDSYKLNSGMSLDVSNGLLPCKATVLSIDLAE